MKTYTDIKTFADACKVERLDEKTIIASFKSLPVKDRKPLIAHAKLVIIARAANRLANGGKKWTPDWNDGQWNKWYPWFDLSGGARGFRYDVCGGWFSGSAASARLCFLSREVGEYVAKQFIDLFREYFVM
jgi:hypothetical protein